MKGIAYNLLYMTVAAIFVAVLFAVGASLMIAGVIETDVEISKTSETLTTDSLVYLTEYCLGKGGPIPAERLNSIGNNVCEAEHCEFCGKGMDVGVKVIDLEPNPGERDLWDFGYEKKDTSRELFTTIEVGDEIHIGRLYVS